jgi:hypothetical protein
LPHCCRLRRSAANTTAAAVLPRCPPLLQFCRRRPAATANATLPPMPLLPLFSSSSSLLSLLPFPSPLPLLLLVDCCLLLPPPLLLPPVSSSLPLPAKLLPPSCHRHCQAARHRRAAAAATALPLLPPHCHRASQSAATAAKVTLLPSCRLHRQAGRRYQAAAVTAKLLPPPPPLPCFPPANQARPRRLTR